MAGILLPMQLVAYAETEVSSGYFYIRNRETGTFLDVPNGQIAWFTEMIVYPYHGSDNQYWEIQPGIDGYCRIRSNLHTNYFLDVANGYTFNGNAVQMFGDYGPSLASSNFAITQNDDDGSYVIRMYNDTSRCIAVNADSEVVVQTYDGSDNQKWYLDDVNFTDKPYDPYYSGYYNIHNAVQYYATLATYDIQVRNEVIFTLTFDQMSSLGAHLAYIGYEDYELEQQQATLNTLLELADLILNEIDVPVFTDIVEMHDKIQAWRNLGIYRADLEDIANAISVASYKFENNEQGVPVAVPKSDDVIYQICFLQQDPVQGRQIKIISSDGEANLIHVVENDTYTTIINLALLYQSGIRFYKIAPGYSYQV